MGRGLGAGLLTLAASVAVVGTATAQQPTGVERTTEGVRLDFQNADLRVVITALADVAGLNVLFSDIPDRQVTLRTSRGVSADEVRGYLESIARAHELTLTEEGGLIRVEGAAVERTDAGRAGPPAPDTAADARTDRRLFVYRLRHAKAEALAGTLGALFGGGDRRAYDDGSRRSLTEQLREDRLAYLPEPAPAAPPARAGGAAPPDGEPGARAGLEGEVQIIPDVRTNSLLIRASTADYETVRHAIEQLDTRPLQVLIEVLIAEVRRNRESALGVGIDVPPEDESGAGGGETTVGGQLAEDVVVDVFGIGAVGAAARLRALSSSGDVTILSRPVILAQNNQEARILVGTQRPFVRLFRALPTDEAVRDQVVQYRDVGTQLTIRPTINPDGYVTLSVLQEVSTATAEQQFGAPVISTREAETELLVKDGGTVVIGGLVDHQRDEASSGIPLLRHIPLLGALFGSSSERDVATELFLFITPHVLRTDAEVEEATEGLRDGTEHLRERLGDDLLLLPAPDSVPVPPDTGVARRSRPPDSTRAASGRSRRDPALPVPDLRLSPPDRLLSVPVADPPPPRPDSAASGGAGGR